MKFFSPKYPQFILGIFLCFTFFFAMPVSNVKAEGECRTDKPPIPAGQKLAKILITPNGTGQGIDNSPTGGKTCYVPILSGANNITYQNLLDANVISSSWAQDDNEAWGVISSCSNDNNEYNTVTGENVPVTSLNILGREKYGCGIHIRYTEQFHPDLERVTNKTTGYLIRLRGGDQYLFFRGFEEGDKTAAETLQACKDAMTQAKDNNQNPCYKPDPAVDSDPEKFFELTKQMPMECKIVFEKCNLGDTPDDPYKDDPRYGKPDGYEGPLPECAFSYNGCSSINDVLQFLVNIGQQVFKYIGTFAFVMFIYGGFTMILSMGSAEKVKKGQEILTAAVVGIIISFGAYLLIDFILDALQVGKDFRSIGALEQADEIPGTFSKK